MKVIQEAFQWAGTEKHHRGKGTTEDWLTVTFISDQRRISMWRVQKVIMQTQRKNTASRNLWAFQLMITPCQGLSTAQHCACLYSHLWFLKSVMHSHCHGQYLGSQLHPAKDTYYLFPLFLALHWPVQHSHLRLVAVIMWNFVYCDTLHSVNQCYYSGYCLQDHCYS